MNFKSLKETKIDRTKEFKKFTEEIDYLIEFFTSFADLVFYSSPWTAEFDWSLILSDTWDFSSKNDVLTLTNSIGDKYTLENQ